MLETFTVQLSALQSLNDNQVGLAVEQLVDATVPMAVKADFLTQLALKGETPDEIAAFARALRSRSIRPQFDAETRAREILDVVGTGGDQLGTFNISTTAALVCAAAGVTVAKHGNRAATSRCGSADVLEALGVRIDSPPEIAATSLRDHNFSFFFAPSYHPAFKNVAPARKLCAERGQRTIFNFLGPLLNPALPSAMLVGVPRPALCEPLAHVLQSLGVRRAMVVCGSVNPGVHPSPSADPAIAQPESRASTWLDELSTLGDTSLAEFYQDHGFTSSVLAPNRFPLQPASLADLVGGDCQANADIVRRLLAGDERGPKRDAVLLNTAAALFVAGRTRSLTEGWELAEATIDSGAADAKLRELQGER